MSAVSPPRRSRDVTVYLVLDPLCVVAFNTADGLDPRRHRDIDFVGRAGA